MCPVSLTPSERTIFDLIQKEVIQNVISKEEGYDRLFGLITESDNDLPSVAKRWSAPLGPEETQISRIQLVLKKMMIVLINYQTSSRIGNSFKDQFLQLWSTVLKSLLSLSNKPDIEEWLAEEVVKKMIKVKDIRWLLKDIEAYIIPYRLFCFAKYNIHPQLEKMSRDNYYILKSYCEDEELIEYNVNTLPRENVVNEIIHEKKKYFTKWLTCDLCRIDHAEGLRAAIENGASYNIRDQASNMTDEMEVALRYGSEQCIRYLQEYEEKEGRPIVLNEYHFDILRLYKQDHLLNVLTGTKKEVVNTTSVNGFIYDDDIIKILLNKYGTCSEPKSANIIKTKNVEVALPNDDDNNKYCNIFGTPLTEENSKVENISVLEEENKEDVMIHRGVVGHRYYRNEPTVVLFYHVKYEESNVVKEREKTLLQLRLEFPWVRFVKIKSTDENQKKVFRLYYTDYSEDNYFNLWFFYQGVHTPYLNLFTQNHNPLSKSSESASYPKYSIEALRRAILLYFVNKQLTVKDPKFQALEEKFNVATPDKMLTVKDVEDYIAYNKISNDPKLWYEHNTTTIQAYNAPNDPIYVPNESIITNDDWIASKRNVPEDIRELFEKVLEKKIANPYGSDHYALMTSHIRR